MNLSRKNFIGAGIHGDVWNVHTEELLKPNTGFFTFFQRAATHTHTTTTTTHTTQHNTQHHTETERETETRQEDKRR